MEYKYKLATTTWDEQEYSALQRVIKSTIFTMGDEVRIFENQFASFFGGKYALMVNSGSSANLLMIASLFFLKNNPLKQGDEVIVPSISWSTTYMPLQQYGLKVKFIDIDLNTLNFDIIALENAVTDKTRLIFAVNLLGNPNDFGEIKRIIKNRDIILLEDNCESMGATFNNNYCGTFGLMGSFSTFFSHHISTMEGGVVLTNDQELYHIMLSLRAHGWTRNLPNDNLVTGKKSDNWFDESFKFVLPGYNLRPLEMSGAIGLEQLKKLPDIIKNRRKNAKTFLKIIKKYPDLFIQEEIGESSWFGFALTLKKESKFLRSDLIEEFNKNSIECRPIVAGNFTKNIAIKYFDYDIPFKLDNANYIDNQGLFLGNSHHNLTLELDLLDKVLNNFFFTSH
jgi:CDP-6-deoxy-D-xylo-4-hexulose-3-dehydrase